MNSAMTLVRARRRANLTQRELALRSGVAQPVIARIEMGASNPRVDTLTKLLGHCGESLVTEPVRGTGIDRSLIHSVLKLTPRQRLLRAGKEADAIDRLLSRATRGRNR